jgi:WD40 repeat protein
VDLTPVCRGVPNTYVCARAIERYQIRRVPHFVSRNDDTLTVRLGRSRLRTFVDNDPEHESGVSYTYREFIPEIGYHLVHAHLYEGTGYLLVSHRTGDMVRIQAPPIFSPDGNRFATASEDLESRYNPNEIQIWRVSENAIVLEWSLEPAGNPVVITPGAWGPMNLRWISPTEIRVQKVTFNPDTFMRTESEDVVIRLVRGRWRVMLREEGSAGRSLTQVTSLAKPSRPDCNPWA